MWEKRRGAADVADFASDNPQEMVVDGFASALASATAPTDKSHYAYEFSEPESQRTMLIRRLDDVDGTERDVHGEGWRSRRLVVSEDGPPYSFHITVVDRGARLRFEYERHRETVYCIDGNGTITDLRSGDTATLEPGGLYSASIAEPHEIVAHTEMTLACIFTPPLEGTEEAD